MRVFGAAAAVIVAIALVVYGSFAIYEGSWSLASHNLNHSLELQRQNANGQAQNAQAGWNYQTMLGQQIVSGIDNVQHDTTSIDQYKQAGNTVSAADETNQRAYDAGQVCGLVTQVNGVLPKESPNTKWVDANCSDGVLKPSSIYYVNG
jgi:hypothetical protein